MLAAAMVFVLLGADPSFTELDQEISEGRRTKNGTNIYTFEKGPTSIVREKYRDHFAILFQGSKPVMSFRYFEPLDQYKDDTIFVSAFVDLDSTTDPSSFAPYPLRILCDNRVVQLKVEKGEIDQKNKSRRYTSMTTASKISEVFKTPNKGIDYRFADIEIKPSREVNDQILEFLKGQEAFRDAVSKK